MTHRINDTLVIVNVTGDVSMGILKSAVPFCFSLVAFTSGVFADTEAGLSALSAGDVATAAAEFEQSYAAGDGDGAFYLGRLFEFGLGTDVDMNRAASLYAAAAEKGSVDAMNRLGLMYLEGTTLLRDYAQAAEYFCAAAELGDANGQLNCALMLREGKGVEMDAARALELLEASAVQDVVAAQNILGQILMEGDGVDPDPARALELFSATANVGNAMGLYELARAFADPLREDGADLVQAYSYANLAAVRGHVSAAELRDALEAEMSPADVTAAQALSQSWTAERLAAQAGAVDE